MECSRMLFVSLICNWLLSFGWIAAAFQSNFEKLSVYNQFAKLWPHADSRTTYPGTLVHTKRC